MTTCTGCACELAEGRDHYLYYNGHGDLAAEADASGNRTALHTYDPFGTPLATQPANTTEHLYTGRWTKQYDTSSQLVLMGARPYDPTLGRFLAIDPIDGGALNNYDYAGQDPVNGYDLSGLMLQDEDVVTGAGAVQGNNCGPYGQDSCFGTEGDASDWTSYDGSRLGRKAKKITLTFVHGAEKNPVEVAAGAVALTAGGALMVGGLLIGTGCTVFTDGVAGYECADAGAWIFVSGLAVAGGGAGAFYDVYRKGRKRG